MANKIKINVGKWILAIGLLFVIGISLITMKVLGVRKEIIKKVMFWLVEGTGVGILVLSLITKIIALKKSLSSGNSDDSKS